MEWNGEVFMPVVGFEGLYEISSLGRVKSLPKTWHTGICNVTMREKYLKIKDGFYPDGRKRYYSVTLKKDKREYIPSIHRLVAMAFVPNPENKPQVNHIDGNKWNNSISNLEWVTPSENGKHAYDTGLHKYNGQNCHLSKYTEETVRKILSYKNSGLLQKEIAVILNVRASYVGNIYRGEIWRHLSKSLNKETCQTQMEII